MSEGDTLRETCKTLGLPEEWASAATTTTERAVNSLSDGVQRMIRAHGCGTVISSHIALRNYEAAGLPCLNDPQLAPLIAAATRQKVTVHLDKEREELLEQFQRSFSKESAPPQAPNNSIPYDVRDVQKALHSTTRELDRLLCLQTHFAKSDANVALPVAVRRIFNNYVQEEILFLRRHSAVLNATQFTQCPPPPRDDRLHKLFFIGVFSRIMDIDNEKERLLKSSNNITNTRTFTVELLTFAWAVEGLMDLQLMQECSHSVGVVWCPKKRIERELVWRRVLYRDASNQLFKSSRECGEYLLRVSISTLLYAVPPHSRFEPFGDSDLDARVLTLLHDDEEAALRRLATMYSGEVTMWRDFLTFIQAAQLRRQETIEAERTSVVRRHVVNAFCSLVAADGENPYNCFLFFAKDSQHESLISPSVQRCSIADALHKFLCNSINRPRCRRHGRTSCFVNPIHPPLEVPFDSILSDTISFGDFSFGLLRYEMSADQASMEALRSEIFQFLWVPVVRAASPEGQDVQADPSLLFAGPLIIRLLFWFLYCSFFDPDQLEDFACHYFDLISQCLATIFSSVAHAKCHQSLPLAHHREGDASSVDYLPFVIIHASLLAFVKTFPSNTELFSEDHFLGPSALLLFQLFSVRRGITADHYNHHRRHMFNHPQIRIVSLIGHTPLEVHPAVDSGVPITTALGTSFDEERRLRLNDASGTYPSPWPTPEKFNRTEGASRDLVVDSEFHIFNADVIANPDCARSIIKKRLRLAEAPQKEALEENDIVGSRTALRSVENKGRAKKLQHLKMMTSANFNPSHFCQSGAITGKGSAGHLDQQVASIRARIISRRAKLRGRFDVSAPKRESSISTCRSSHDETSSAQSLFSSSKRLSMVFKGSSLNSAALAKTMSKPDDDDDGLDVLEADIQALVLPRDVVQCHPFAAVLIANFVSKTSDCVQSPPVVQAPAAGGGENNKSLGDHIFQQESTAELSDIPSHHRPFVDVSPYALPQSSGVAETRRDIVGHDAIDSLFKRPPRPMVMHSPAKAHRSSPSPSIACADPDELHFQRPLQRGDVSSSLGRRGLSPARELSNPRKPTSGPVISAPIGASVERVNLHACSPSISRLLPQVNQKVHNLSFICQPLGVREQKRASKLAATLRDQNTKLFEAQDYILQERRTREVADLQASQKSKAKKDAVLLKELRDPLRRTDFVDDWIAREAPKVSTIDIMSEVQHNGQRGLPMLWEGTRSAIEAKRNALALKDTMRRAERIVHSRKK